MESPDGPASALPVDKPIDDQQGDEQRDRHRYL
jgi:hypothetical protein